jgi:lactate dehydrogenase-like 2-hydroxyacid dehydrogenase
LPKNTNLLNDEHFQLFGNNKILVNTTLGTSFKPDAFKNWMNNKRNYAIMDGSGMGINTSEFIQFENMIGTKKTSGFTKEAKNRLAQKVIHNIETYLKTEHSELG